MSAPPVTLRRGPRPKLRGRLHLAGAVVLAASSPFLLSAASGGRRWAVATYVLGVTAMLAASALYHVPDWTTTVARRLRRVDHSAIFLAIGGTYTPIVVAAMDGAARIGLLAVVWVGAIAGIAIRNVFHGASARMAATPYVVLGWISVVAVPALWRLSPSATTLVAAGGLVYTVGAVVYARQRPDPWPTVFGYHEVFHALTLVAVALHWAAVRVTVSA
jgi:hemolysin III